MAKNINKKPIPPIASRNKTSRPKITGKPEEVKKEGLKFRWSLHLKLALFLGAICFLVYANSLKNGYVLDDDSAISENTIVTKGISAIPELMTTPYHRGFFVSSNDLYRPLSLVMFAVEYQLFGLDPLPNHLINIIVYALGVILLFFFLDKLFYGKKTGVAFLASVLFALHPLHTEVVANIKSRDELLCFMLVFLSLHVLMRYAQTGKLLQLAGGCVLFLLSMLAKETVITFIVIIPFIFFFYLDENKKRSAYISTGIVLMVLVSLAMRFSVLTAYQANGMADINFSDNALALKTLPYSSRLATAILVLGYYLKLLVIPFPLICDYNYAAIPFVTFTDPMVLLSIAAYLGMFVFAVLRFLNNRKDPYAFAIIFFLVTISLFSNIVFLIGSNMGERFMYFGLAGFCLVVALLIEKLAGEGQDVLMLIRNPKVLAVMVPVSLAYSMITINRNTEWQSNYTLYSADIKKSPRSGKLNYFYGLELEKTVAPAEKDPARQLEIRKEGLTYLQKAVAVDSGYSNYQSALGNAFSFLRQYDSAEVHELKSIETNPLNYISIDNLAGVYFFEKKYKQSIEYSRRAIAIKPDFVYAYGNLGRCYVTLGKNDSAIYFSYQGIAIDPNYSLPYQLLAYAYKGLGKEDSVKKYVQIFRRFKPDFNL